MRKKMTNKAGSNPVRSVRVPDLVWKRARSRAIKDHVSLSYVIGTFLEGYANKDLNLPKVTVSYEDIHQMGGSK